MSILITGASGFIGGHLAARLISEGKDCRLLVRDRSRLRKDLQTHKNVIIGDLANQHALRTALENVDYIFHCAANVATWDNREAYFKTNRDGTRSLLQALARHTNAIKRFVHLSTVDVYGFPQMPADELSPINPGSYGYAQSKAAGEQMLHEFAAQHSLNFTIVRPCNVIGEGSPFVRQIGDALRKGVMLSIDHGTANAGVIDVNNLVSYLVCLGNLPAAAGNTYNARDPYDVNWNEFCSMLNEQLAGRGRYLKLSYASARKLSKFVALLFKPFPLEPPIHPLLVDIFGRTCGHDASKLHAACRLSDSISFEESMQRGVRWYLAQ